MILLVVNSRILTSAISITDAEYLKFKKELESNKSVIADKEKDDRVCCSSSMLEKLKKENYDNLLKGLLFIFGKNFF